MIHIFGWTWIELRSGMSAGGWQQEAFDELPTNNIANLLLACSYCWLADGGKAGSEAFMDQECHRTIAIMLTLHLLTMRLRSYQGATPTPCKVMIKYLVISTAMLAACWLIAFSLTTRLCPMKPCQPKQRKERKKGTLVIEDSLNAETKLGTCSRTLEHPIIIEDAVNDDDLSKPVRVRVRWWNSSKSERARVLGEWRISAATMAQNDLCKVSQQRRKQWALLRWWE